MAIKAVHTRPEKIYCDKFDTAQVSNLSLFLFKDHYFLFARDINGKVAAIHQMTFDNQRRLLQQLKEDKLLRLEVPKRIFHYGESFSLVPGILFDASLLSVYLFFAEKPKEGDKLFQTSLESNTLHLVGSIDEAVSDALQSGYSDTYFHHGASCFLSYALKEKFNLIDQEILLVLYDSFFYLAAFSKQEIVLFNRFEAYTKDDVLRYLMGILQQMGFNRNHCRVTVYGDCESLGIDEAWGETYFRNFKISTPHPNLQYLEGTEEFQQRSLFESYWVLP
nr:DUF3822 family protein [Mariniradius saccharolyticus]